MNSKIIIGIDLGGTKIMTGAITYQGKVVGKPVKVPTEAEGPAETTVNRIISSVERTLNDQGLTISDVDGIGIGSTGPLDMEKGLILECPQLPNMNYFPLRETIEKHFCVPVRMNNDANCLILGECIFGAAADKRLVVGFTLGTGIGCAVVVNKKILNGSTGTAAEIWHSPYKDGIIEDYVCGAGVSKIYKSISGKEKNSLDISAMASDGDKQAIQTWNEFGMHLAVPLAWSVNLIDPDVVVIGGSVSKAYPFFKATMEDNFRKWTCPVPSEKTKVVLSKLGDDAGFIGAACLMIDNK
ncbi:MAG TPA: ROK family protein [Bacteroidales bacterium]|nr:ROK family protein [Bacteroidales bacterium]